MIQRPVPLKSHFDWPLDITTIIISLRRHYYHSRNDFHFINNIACYSSLETMIEAETEAAITMTTIFCKSDNNSNIRYECRNLSKPKTELSSAKVSPFQPLTPITKSPFSDVVGVLDATLIKSVQMSWNMLKRSTLSSTLSQKRTYGWSVLLQ